MQVRLGHLRQLAGAQRRGPGVQQQTALALNSTSRCADRKSAPLFLSRRHPKGLSQFFRIRHGKTRAVHMEHAMAMPEVTRLMRPRLQLFADVAEQIVIDPQRQPLPRLAIRLGAERGIGQVTHFAAGNIAVQHLLHEQGDGRGRVQFAVAQS